MRKLLPWLLVLVLPAGLPAAEPEGKAKSDEVERKLIPVLIEALHDSEPTVRGQAAESLVAIGPAALPRLLKLLQHKDDSMRAHAAYVLASFAQRSSQQFREMARKDASIRIVLLEALKDPQVYVRDRAVQILTNLGRDALPDLTALLKGEDESGRIIAASIIGDLFTRGEAPRETLLSLAELLRDRKTKVREAAAFAINQGLSMQQGTGFGYPSGGSAGYPQRSASVPPPPK